MKQWIEGIGAQNYAKTDHFIQRQGQRKISNLLVTMAMACGEKFYQGPEQVYFLGRKHLMQARRMFGDILTDALIPKSRFSCEKTTMPPKSRRL